MSAKNPLVSVCLPVFNGEEYLPLAIESALSQTYTNLELIIIDDCSTDKSWDIIQKYAHIDNRVNASKNSNNTGLFANYNKCLSQVKGHYIKPFAQDDLLKQNWLEKALSIFSQMPEVAFVSTSRNWVNEKGIDVTSQVNFTSADMALPANKSISGLTVIEKSLFPLWNFIGEPACVMFKAEFKGDGFDSTLYHLGDLEYWIRILKNGNYYYVNEELCSFRHHSANRSSTNTAQLVLGLDLLRMAYKHKQLFSSLRHSEEEFIAAGLSSIARDAFKGYQNGSLSFEDIKTINYLTNHQSQEQLVEDLKLFRELYFRTLIMNSQNESNDNESINILEAKLQSILNSKSWKYTKILRELSLAFQRH